MDAGQEAGAVSRVAGFGRRDQAHLPDLSIHFHSQSGGSKGLQSCPADVHGLHRDLKSTRHRQGTEMSLGKDRQGGCWKKSRKKCPCTRPHTPPPQPSYLDGGGNGERGGCVRDGLRHSSSGVQMVTKQSQSLGLLEAQRHLTSFGPPRVLIAAWQPLLLKEFPD